MLSGEDVLKLGEVQVSRSQYYVSQEDKRPVDNGVLDAHMVIRFALHYIHVMSSVITVID